MSDLDQLNDQIDDIDLLDDDLNFDEKELGGNAGLPDTLQAPSSRSNLSMLRDIPVEVTVEVSRRSLSLKELMKLEPSSVIMLDKQEGEPIDIKINGVLFGTGSIITKDGKYGVQILSLVDNGNEE